MSSTSAISVYFLDAYHVGDPSFVSRLARHIRTTMQPTLVLADPEDRVILALEEESPTRGEPGFSGPRGSRMERLLAGEVVSDGVRRAVLESIRSVVAVFTEEQVPAVGIQGSDRGLLIRDPDGDVRCGDWTWIRNLALAGAVPVISPLATGSERDVQTYVNTAKAVCAINIGVMNQVDRLILFRRESAARPVVESALGSAMGALNDRADPIVFGLADLRRDTTK